VFIFVKKKEAGIITSGCIDPLEASKCFSEEKKVEGTNLDAVVVVL